MSLSARIGRALILAVTVSISCPAPGASNEEARLLSEEFTARFAWFARAEVLALMLDADARVVFHKLLDGRPLRPSDPEWRSHYSAFQKEYADAVIKNVGAILWMTPKVESLLREALAKDLSSADANVVLAFLKSAELRAAANDAEFQTTWVRLLTIYPRFQEHELSAFFSMDELQALQGSVQSLSTRYPNVFATLMDAGPSTPPTIKRAFSILARLASPGALAPVQEQQAMAARVAAAQQQVINKWKLIVGGGKPSASQEGPWNLSTIMPADLESTGAPRFEHYAAPLKHGGRPAAVILESHRDAPLWRTQLREGAKKGPNFADHYSLVTWGCGTDCMQVAIVDARSGTVFFPTNLGALHFVNVHDDVLRNDVLRFRRDSALLVAVGTPNEDARQRGVSYYIWTGSALKLVHRVKRDGSPGQQPNRPMQPTAAGGG